MKLLIKIVLIIVILITTSTLIGNTKNNLYTTSNATTTNQTNVGVVVVVVSNINDPYLDGVKQSLENIQRKSENKVKSNNDAMAIGAVESLQKYGYNKGDKSKTIPIISRVYRCHSYIIISIIHRYS